MKEAIAAAVSGQEVAAPLMEAAMSSMFSGEASPAQMAALLVALHIKGETAQEIATAATVMRRYCVRVELSPKPVVLDTCGTGGDGSQTFNISTAAALVIAACGVPLAKHGNRAATSRTGSADVLEVLGVQIELSPERVARCIEEVGIGFMFARTHHPAMRHVGPVRAELGVRTLFNFLGPLTNPASATHQLIGVPEPRLLGMMAGALAALGAQRAWIVHGDARLDELALTGPTRVAQLDGGVISEFVVTPEDFGLMRHRPGADLRVQRRARRCRTDPASRAGRAARRSARCGDSECRGRSGGGRQSGCVRSRRARGRGNHRFRCRARNLDGVGFGHANGPRVTRRGQRRTTSFPILETANVVSCCARPPAISCKCARARE